MEKITITGTAENSKTGAIVVTNDNKVYYLEGIGLWNDEILKKQVRVDGDLIIEHFDEADLVNEKGEYKQGLSGEIKKITKPEWKLVNPTLENDDILEKLEKSLPEGWIMKIENDTLIISCKEKAYLLFENKINAPLDMETEQQKEERFKKYGQLVNPQFVFVLKNKLSTQEINHIKSENNKIKASISKLYQDIKDIPTDRKDGSFEPRNEKEEKIVANFEKEKTKLENKIVKLPDYQSENYALFLESETGIETEFTSVFPEKYSEKLYKIKLEIFGKVLVVIK